MVCFVRFIQSSIYPPIPTHKEFYWPQITVEHRDDAGSCNWVGLIWCEVVSGLTGLISGEAVNWAWCSWSRRNPFKDRYLIATRSRYPVAGTAGYWETCGFGVQQWKFSVDRDKQNLGIRNKRTSQQIMDDAISEGAGNQGDRREVAKLLRLHHCSRSALYWTVQISAQFRSSLLSLRSWNVMFTQISMFFLLFMTFSLVFSSALDGFVPVSLLWLTSVTLYSQIWTRDF